MRLRVNRFVFLFLIPFFVFNVLGFVGLFKVRSFVELEVKLEMESNFVSFIVLVALTCETGRCFCCLVRLSFSYLEFF